MKTSTFLVILGGVAVAGLAAYKLLPRRARSGTAQSLNDNATVPKSWWQFSSQYPATLDPGAVITPSAMPDIWGSA